MHLVVFNDDEVVASLHVGDLVSGMWMHAMNNGPVVLVTAASVRMVNRRCE